MYQAVKDQLIVAGLGQVVGIYLPAIESQMRIMRVPLADREELAADVQLIGRTICQLQNGEQKKKEGMRGQGIH